MFTLLFAMLIVIAGVPACYAVAGMAADGPRWLRNGVTLLAAVAGVYCLAFLLSQWLDYMLDHDRIFLGILRLTLLWGLLTGATLVAVVVARGKAWFAAAPFGAFGLFALAMAFVEWRNAVLGVAFLALAVGVHHGQRLMVDWLEQRDRPLQSLLAHGHRG